MFLLSDKNYQNHQHLNQMEQDMEEATKQVRQLRDDLQKKQTYIMKMEADAIGNAVRICAYTKVCFTELSLSCFGFYFLKQ